MSRKNKFKAWSKVNKCWVDAGLLHDPYTVPVIPVDQNVFRLDDANVIFVQYTGLKDMDGTEIYEGDILENGIGMVKVVVFHNGSFRLSNSKTPPKHTASILHAAKIFKANWSLIGNVFENPTLLEEESRLDWTIF